MANEIETRLIHNGEPRSEGAVGVPIFQSSTFLTRGDEFGYDLSLHSATKYLNGHDDVVAGAVIGSRALVREVTHLTNHLGGTLDPHACVLLHRGLKTLALRVRQQNANALALAKFLWSHPAVARVNYPG